MSKNISNEPQTNLTPETLLVSKGSTDTSKKKRKQDFRQLEPLGAIGFALIFGELLVTALAFPLGSALPVRILAALIGGSVLVIKSLIKFKRDGNKWKGKGFVLMAMVLMAIFLVIYVSWFLYALSQIFENMK